MPDDSWPRLAWRAAAAIHTVLVRRPPSTAGMQLPETPWNNCRRLTRLLTRAETGGFPFAAARLRRNLAQSLEQLTRMTDTLAGRMQELARPAAVLPPAQIAAELLALKTEFEDVACDPATGSLSVTVGPIELEGVDLGRFRIMLDWNEALDNPPYWVEACEPNYASNHEDVPHPHVQNESLCTGEGGRAIRQALEQGRLCDFFLVVQQILWTYNSGSAYAQLHEWYGGEPCTECGKSVDPDYSDVCEFCCERLCEECSRVCRACRESCCVFCSKRCVDCEDDVCHSCCVPCTGCQSKCCPECREGGKFDDCRTKAETAKNDAGDGGQAAPQERAPADEGVGRPRGTSAPAAAGTAELAVQPLCLGEVVVSA